MAAVIVGSPSCWTLRTIDGEGRVARTVQQAGHGQLVQGEHEDDEPGGDDRRPQGRARRPIGSASSGPAPLARAARTWSPGSRSTRARQLAMAERPELRDVGHQDDRQRVAQPAAVGEQDGHREGRARNGEAERDRGARGAATGARPAATADGAEHERDASPRPGPGRRCGRARPGTGASSAAAKLSSVQFAGHRLRGPSPGSGRRGPARRAGGPWPARSPPPSATATAAPRPRQPGPGRAGPSGRRRDRRTARPPTRPRRGRRRRAWPPSSSPGRTPPGPPTARGPGRAAW